MKIRHTPYESAGCGEVLFAASMLRAVIWLMSSVMLDWCTSPYLKCRCKLKRDQGVGTHGGTAVGAGLSAQSSTGIGTPVISSEQRDQIPRAAVLAFQQPRPRLAVELGL